MTGTRMRRAAGALASAVAAAAAVAVVGGSPADAGGSEWMYPVRDRYEPGQDVLMVGYTTTAQPQTATGGRYYAWLRVDPAANARGEHATGTYVDPTDVRVAPVVVEGATVDESRGRRATISFTLPDDLPRGRYQLVLCDDPCTEAPGFLSPGNLAVGVAPEYEVIRDWPESEPAIRWLAEEALLYTAYGVTVTAADFRAGRHVAQPVPPATEAPAPAVTPTSAAPVPPAAGSARSRVDGECP